MTRTERQAGAVSIFVVVFAALLMIVVTMSFVQLMLKDQSQATTSDLSQSAYDSAQAGVEDAKRLLLLQQSCTDGTVPAGFVARCGAVTTALNSNACNTVSTIFGDPTKETLVQQSENDKTLQQAYTCVKVTPNTPDYVSQLKVNESNVIPLSSASAFNLVQINWFTADDLAAGGGGSTIGTPSLSMSLPRIGPLWQPKDPALLRMQFMQTGSSYKLSDFDTTQASGESDANTVFLYPAVAGSYPAAGPMSLALDSPRRTPGGVPQPVKCTSFTTSQYACSVLISLPTYNGPYDQRNAFLHLSALYNGAHYSVQLFNNNTTTPVDFKGVQSIVDSTGRANNMFRRVSARVELKGDFAYPEAALDLKNNLCKDFSITSNPNDYMANAACDPNRAN